MSDIAVRAEPTTAKKSGRPPRVSIGLPVYNGERYLEEAIQSILDQTFEDFELVICDNASTDRTEEICRDYAQRDDRIRYFRNTRNEGAGRNFRRVFELSRGEYFRWACYDDRLAPECIEACVEVLDAEPEVVLAFPEVIVIGEDGEPMDGTDEELRLRPLDLRQERPHERFEAFLRTYYPVGGKCNTLFGLIRRDELVGTPLIADFASSDKILLGEMALRGRFHEIDRPLFLRRDHPGTSVRAHRSPEALAEWFKPGSGARLVLPHWTWWGAYASAVARAPISAREKAICFYLIGRRYVRHRWRNLSAEASGVLRTIARRLTKRPGAST